MSRPRRSIIRRILVQTDCAFWCIHEHPDALAVLALPTVGALLAAALTVVIVWRTWAFPEWLNVLLAGLVLPFVALLIFTAMPLPCAVFAWLRACGEEATVGKCYAWCGRRAGRLLGVLFRLALLWLFSLLLAGIPLLWIWPATCLTPLVALLENQDRIFKRSRRILREDLGVYLIGALYLAMSVVLGSLVATPRLLLSTPALGSHLLETNWREFALRYLWIFETLSATVLLTVLAVSWWISLTLVYHEIRWFREGEALQGKIAAFREKSAGLKIGEERGS